MTVSELSRHIRAELSPQVGQSEADAMERIIMESVMHMSRVDTLVRGDSEVPDFIPAKIDSIIARIKEGEPIQYVVGTARFCGLDFEVTPSVLIPRPETERLVDMIADDCGSRADLHIIDCGTGSGCIAASLARALKFPQVTAIDVSPDALDVARRNFKRLKVDVDALKADMLRPATMPDGEFDVIVSNPPYVLESEKAEMESHVKDREPSLALFVPDSDPLRFYRALLEYAATHMAADGTVYFEINPLEADRFEPLARQAGFADTRIVTDIHQRRRFAVIRR